MSNLFNKISPVQYVLIVLVIFCLGYLALYVDANNKVYLYENEAGEIVELNYFRCEVVREVISADNPTFFIVQCYNQEGDLEFTTSVKNFQEK